MYLHTPLCLSLGVLIEPPYRILPVLHSWSSPTHTGFLLLQTVPMVLLSPLQWLLFSSSGAPLPRGPHVDHSITL